MYRFTGGNVIQLLSISHIFCNTPAMAVDKYISVHLKLTIVSAVPVCHFVIMYIISYI